MRPRCRSPVGASINRIPLVFLRHGFCLVTADMRQVSSEVGTDLGNSMARDSRNYVSQAVGRRGTFVFSYATGKWTMANQICLSLPPIKWNEVNGSSKLPNAYRRKSIVRTAHKGQVRGNRPNCSEICTRTLSCRFDRVLRMYRRDIWHEGLIVSNRKSQQHRVSVVFVPCTSAEDVVRPDRSDFIVIVPARFATETASGGSSAATPNV